MIVIVWRDQFLTCQNPRLSRNPQETPLAKHLPPLLADSFVNLIVLGTAILLIASIYSLFLPEAYSLWTGIIKPRSEERYINAMEAALASGRDLTVKQRKRLSEILERQDSERVLRQRADNLRPQLSTPVEEEPA